MEEAKWMITTGAIWGVTNALMKRGTAIASRKSQKSASSLIWRFVEDWISLLRAWDYSIPFLVNLSASAMFFFKLGSSEISMAVPVTNATTFATTALAGAVLGERLQPWYTLAGLLLIIIGILVCIFS